jgi:GTP-binding protein
MPGYGYAEAPKSTVKAWTALIHAYLSGRSNLARVYVLIDARHGLKTADDAVLKTLDVAAVSYQIVLTKGDQVPAKELETRLADTAAAIKKRAAAFPDILVTSSREGTGMPELRATIARMVAERS